MDFNTFRCPILERTLTVNECFDISMVAEDSAPSWTLPDELQDAGLTEKQKEICLKCEYHIT